MQGAGGVDDDRVDARKGLDQCHAARRAEHEKRRGQGFAGQGVLADAGTLRS